MKRSLPAAAAAAAAITSGSASASTSSAAPTASAVVVSASGAGSGTGTGSATATLTEPAAFAVFAAELSEPLFRQALAIMRDADLAQDVVQQTLIRAWERADELPAHPAARRAWCGQVLLNFARMALRSHKARSRREADAASQRAQRVAVEAQDPVREVIAEEAWSLAMELPAPIRQVLSLRFGMGMTLRETAEALGVPEGTVATRQRSGLESLRRRLGVSPQHAATLAGVAGLALLAEGLTAAVAAAPPTTAAAAMAAAGIRQVVAAAVAGGAVPAGGAAVAGGGGTALGFVAAAAALLLVTAAVVVPVGLAFRPAASPAPAERTADEAAAGTPTRESVGRRSGGSQPERPRRAEAADDAPTLVRFDAADWDADPFATTVADEAEHEAGPDADVDAEAVTEAETEAETDGDEAGADAESEGEGAEPGESRYLGPVNLPDLTRADAVVPVSVPAARTWTLAR